MSQKPIRAKMDQITTATEGMMASKVFIEQLLQLFNGTTWDGNLISKRDRDGLVQSGFAVRARGGYNLITVKGVEYLLDLGLIHP